MTGGSWVSWVRWNLLAMMMWGVGCQSEAAPVEEPRRGAPVDVLELKAVEFVDRFEVLGTAQPQEVVRLSSDVPGRILRALVEEGDPVQRGQRVFQIDLEVDAAGVGVLQTQRDAAQRELERIEELRREGLATAQQLDRARTELAGAEQNLRQRELSVSRNQVTSPIAGFLATRMADAGEYANAGAPLAEVIDIDRIVVHAQVPESEIRYVNREGEVDVLFPGLNQVRKGQIHRVALRASDASRTYRVEIYVENEDHQILPGMRARLEFERERYEGVVLLPRDAILEGFRGREAMVVEGGVARVRTVTLGPGSGTEVVVLEGLSEGDQVILRGHRGLIDGARVEVITEQAQPATVEDPS
jgi:membrane fusion protein, multidrug efflux system